MKLLNKLLSILFLLAGVSLGYAQPTIVTITNGKMTPSGSFSGSFVIDATTGIISTGQISAVAGATTYTLVPEGLQTVPNTMYFADGNHNFFFLYVHGAINALSVNTEAVYTQCCDAQLIVGDPQTARYDAVSATLTTGALPPAPPAPVVQGMTLYVTEPVAPATDWIIGLGGMAFLSGVTPGYIYNFTCSSPVAVATAVSVKAAAVSNGNKRLARASTKDIQK